MSTTNLDEAVRALRVVYDGRSPSVHKTESWIVEKLELSRKRRGQWLRWWPLAAMFIGSTAWATTKSSWPEHVRNWMMAMHFTTSPAGTPQARAKSTSAAPESSQALPSPKSYTEAYPGSSVEVTPAQELVTQSRIEVSRQHSAKARPSTASDSTPPNDGAPTPPSILVERPPSPLELFRTAHQLHFSGADRTETLAAWNAYLEADPRGPLALEARFNRGVCLVQLGKTAEATRELTPFARGDYGSYRREEARVLLGRLNTAR